MNKTATNRPFTVLMLMGLSAMALAQGFPATWETWPVPQGGAVYDGLDMGFWRPTDFGYDPGSDGWTTTDLNGDGLPDLVCTSTRNANYIMTEFSPAGDSHWKVYLNTGGAFSATPLTWALPNGGDVNNGVNRGFWTVSAVGDDPGSDNWSTFDIDGDGLPDLVCTGVRNSNGYVTEFSPAAGSYWKVYLNTGSGFSTTSVNWSLPEGGESNGGVNTGFWALEAIGEDIGSDAWITRDMDGDARPDLVCTGSRGANDIPTEFSPAADSYWKVYLNTGTGFVGTPTTWPLPEGGDLAFGQGFFWGAGNGLGTGADGWTTLDIDGDGRPDLVCTSTRNASGRLTEFSPASDSYWKVFLNNGAGFNTTSVVWSLPDGGETFFGQYFGFWRLDAFGEDVGSSGWNTFDINGDERPDLVCMSERVASGRMSAFSPQGNSYWKVYLNTGSGFGAQTTWSLPAGGDVYQGEELGFWSLSAFGQDDGTDGWSVVDINGDGRMDLVITCENVGFGAVVFNPAGNSYWKAFLQDLTTGLSPHVAAEELQLHLDPATRVLQVIGPADMQEVLLLDAAGRMVHRARAHGGRCTLHLGGTAAGAYIVRPLGSAGLAARRVVVD
jgi:hypothetical protein